MQKTIVRNINEFRKWLSDNGKTVMSLDTETTDLRYYPLELLGFSLANGDEACYVNDVSPLVLSELKNLVENLQLCIMHNAVYDLKVLHKYDIEPTTIFCTLVGAQMLNENLEYKKGGYALKGLAHRVLKVPEEEILLWKELDPMSDEFADYGMNDAIWTFRLFELMVPKLEQQNLLYVFETVEMPFQFVLMDLESNGVLVDQVTLEEFTPQIMDILEMLTLEMYDELGGLKRSTRTITRGKRKGTVLVVEPINLNSSDQLADAAENILGLKIIEKSKSGKKSVDKKTIARLKPKSRFFELLHRYRKLNTLYKNFVKPCYKFIDPDSRIRASYRMVRTGRLSCSKPNLQNLPNPKREKLEFNHRKLFKAGPGNVFIKADWAGQELRVLAEETQDPFMINMFNMNRDLHFITANKIFDLGLTIDEMTTGTDSFEVAKAKYKSERYRAKNGVNFPVIYGMSVRTLAQDFNITLKEAERWMNSFFELYPRVKEAIEATRIELEEREYVTNMMGRRRRFPGYNELPEWKKAGCLRQAFNFKIQGYSAEMMKLAASEIRKILPQFNAMVVLTIHDELIYECAEEVAEELAVRIQDIMEHVVLISIPILVEVSIVKTYGD